MFLFHVIKFFFFIPMSIMFPTKFVGKENLPQKNAVMVCNHTSNIDGLLFAAHLKEKNFYLAKKELFDTKFKAFVMRNIGCISIDRSINDMTAIKKCLKVLKDGRKLVIFPEGTRVNNENMQLGEIKAGAAMLAIKTKTPVVPIYINRKPKLFKKVVVTIGKPFEFTQFYEGRLDSDKQEQAGEILADKMNELRLQVIDRDYKNSKEYKRKIKLQKKEEKKLSKSK